MPCWSRRWKRFPGDLNALSAPARANRSTGGRSGSARCRSNRRRGSRTAQAAESPPRSAVPDEDQHHKNGTENKERRCDGGQGLGVHQDPAFIGDPHGLEQAVSNGRHALRFFSWPERLLQFHCEDIACRCAFANVYINNMQASLL